MADFSKASGNSMKDVELIAVVRPNKTAYKKDEAGKPTSEPLAHYVDVMVNNSGLKKGEIKEGKGQEQPNLYTKSISYTDKNGETQKGFDHGVRFTPGQLDTIKKAGEGKSLTKEDGTMYIPFKADLMPLTETVKGKDGDTKKMVGYIPNTKTVEPSDTKLTQNRLDKHFENTKAIGEVKDAERAAAKASKDAKLSADASKSAPQSDKGKEKDTSAEFPI